MENEFYKKFSEQLKVSSSKKPSSKKSDEISIETVDPSCIYSVKNKLIRVQYPGIVNNLDKALETLGGIRNIENAVANPSHKLQLNFHPDNKFNKGSVADSNSKSNGLLLKIKREKSYSGQIYYNYEIVGSIEKSFVFNKLIDFQYLPLVANHPETAESTVDYIHDKIFPEKLPNWEDVKEHEKSVPLFTIPVNFSRTDLRRKFQVEKQKTENQSSSELKPAKKCIALAKSSQLSTFHKFSDPTVPEGPNELASALINREVYAKAKEKFEKLFEERPIWTKNGLKHATGYSHDMMKMMIPGVAYYAPSGPWRCSWIRFGYDPRKDPQSRIYQILDYRIPTDLKSNSILKRGRSTGKIIQSKDDQKSTRIYPEKIYILKPNVMPAFKQNFYQYCDIHLPEVQLMLERLPTLPPNTVCSPKNGWLPSNFADQCREIINSHLDKFRFSEVSENNSEANTDNVEATTSQKVKSNDYQSLIIRNVKRKLYGEDTSIQDTENVTEILDTDSDEEIGDTSDDDSLYQDVTFDENVYSLNDGQENMEIDVDALEDVKNIIASTSTSRKT